MAKLIVNPSSSSRREIALPRTVTSIGRDPSNDVVLPDAMVSRRHAVIEYRGTQYFLRDCNSSNGSLVNGDRISERGLRDGDLVAIGTARLLFRDERASEEPAGKVVPHPSAPRLVCPSCQADFRKGDLYCRHCGASLALAGTPRVACTDCGTVVPLPARFCNACGQRLPPVDGRPAEARTPEAGGAAPSQRPTEPVPAAEAVGVPDEAEERQTGAEGRPRSAPLAEPASDPQDRPLDEGPPRRDRAGRASAGAVHRAGLAAGAAVVPAVPPAGVVRPPDPALAPVADRLPKPGRLALPTGTRILTPASGVSWPGAVVPPAVVPAAAGWRLLSALVDAAAVTAAAFVLLSPSIAYWAFREGTEEPSFVAVLLSLALVPVAAGAVALYYIHHWGRRGATPGQQLFGLAVVTEEGGGPIGLARASARFLGYLLSAALLGVGFLMVALGRVGLHDTIAGTRVVRRRI